jgi:ankyrin repeat protein
VTEKLLAARCNVNVQDNDGTTPLIEAAAQGHEAITKQLLAVRCNVNIQWKGGHTALQVAQRQGHTAIATLIRNKKQETPLLGRRVVIDGLVAKHEINGRNGTAVSFDDDKGRYSVELDDTSSFMIKPCNLLLTV